ncbi:hypothetical protein P7C70_g2785, partial [Phenoliferia sp. Uapishka_3]
MVSQFTLSTGAKIDLVGYGTWQAAPNEVKVGISEAIKAGYRKTKRGYINVTLTLPHSLSHNVRPPRHLDLAKIYQNQEEVRAGIAAAGVPRSELFLTSKLWNTSHRPDLVEPALDDTLKELGVEYLDLYLIHWPVPFEPRPATHTTELFPLNEKKEVSIDTETTLVDTWKAMIKLLDTGKVKAIGVSNFTVEAIDKISAATGVVPAAHQIERHPLLIQPELVAHHKAKNIHITAYSPLGNNNVGAPKLFEYPEVIKIAEKLSVTPAQVLIAWGQVGGHSVIPKSITPSRIQSNFQQITLPKEDFDEISKLGEAARRHRFNIPNDYDPSWHFNVFGEESEKEAKYGVNVGA